MVHNLEAKLLFYRIMRDKPVILVADDDRGIRGVVKAILQRDYHVVTVWDGTEALACVSRSANDVDLVLADITMPLMTGIELAEKLREAHPELPVILMSAAMPDTLFCRKSSWPFLPKPFSASELRDIVQRVLVASVCLSAR